MTIEITDISTDTKQVTLKFKRDQLLYDIKNYAYVEGEVMGEEKQHAQHTLVDIGEEGNVDRVNRLLALYHAYIVQLLYPYTKQEEEGEEIDDRIWTPEEYVITMQVPSTFSKTSAHLLERLIHEFLVYKVLADWIGITNPAASVKWADKAEKMEESIEETKNMRNCCLTRPLQPF